MMSEPSPQFNNLLVYCSTDKQRQCLSQIRELIIIHNKKGELQEFSNTRHMKYGKQESDPYIEIKLDKTWTNPKIFFVLTNINRLYKQTTKKTRYAAEIDEQGEVFDYLSLYQRQKFIYTGHKRQLGKVLEILSKEPVKGLSNQLKLKKLIELTIDFNIN